MTTANNDALVKRIKELVAEPRHRITLDDLVREHLRSALGALAPAKFSFPYPVRTKDLRDVSLVAPGIETIAAHSRCRLPEAEIQIRLTQYQQG